MQIRRRSFLTYGTLSIALIAALLTPVIVQEFRRHQLLVHHDPRIRFVVESRLPPWVRRQLPVGVVDSWFVQVKSVAFKLETASEEAFESTAVSQKFPEVRALRLIAPRVDSEILRQVAQFEQLEQLIIQTQEVTGGLDALENCRELSKLVVHCDSWNDPHETTAISKLLKLEKLRLQVGQLGERQLTDIGRNPNLRVLEGWISGCPGGELAGPSMTEIAIHVSTNPSELRFGDIPQLQSLSIDCMSLNGTHLKKFAHLRNLKSLHLVTHGRFGAELQQLIELPNLESLKIAGPQRRDPDPAPLISAEGVQALLLFPAKCQINIPTKSLSVTTETQELSRRPGVTIE